MQLSNSNISNHSKRRKWRLTSAYKFNFYKIFGALIIRPLKIVWLKIFMIDVHRDEKITHLLFACFNFLRSAIIILLVNLSVGPLRSKSDYDRSSSGYIRPNSDYARLKSGCTGKLFTQELFLLSYAVAYISFKDTRWSGPEWRASRLEAFEGLRTDYF